MKSFGLESEPKRHRCMFHEICVIEIVSHQHDFKKIMHVRMHVSWQKRDACPVQKRVVNRW